MDLREARLLVYSYESLKKIAKTLHRLDENACNYGLSKSQETREKNLEKEAREIAAHVGFKIYRQGDPRGCPLYLVDDTCGDNYTDGIVIVY